MGIRLGNPMANDCLLSDSLSNTVITALPSCQAKIASKTVKRSISKPGFLQNLSCKNEFDLDENEPGGRLHFDTNGFAQRLVLTQRQSKAYFGQD